MCSDRTILILLLFIFLISCVAVCKKAWSQDAGEMRCPMVLLDFCEENFDSTSLALKNVS